VCVFVILYLSQSALRFCDISFFRLLGFKYFAEMEEFVCFGRALVSMSCAFRALVCFTFELIAPLFLRECNVGEAHALDVRLQLRKFVCDILSTAIFMVQVK